MPPPPPPPPPPGLPPPGPPPPPANTMPPPSQPGRKALLASIENKPRLKKVDKSQINDRSGPSVGGSTGGGPPAMGGSALPGAGPLSGPKLPPVASRAPVAVPPPPANRTGSSQRIDMTASARPAATQKLPVRPPVPHMNGPSQFPPRPPQPPPPSGRRHSITEEIGAPVSRPLPSPPSFNSHGTGKTPPPPPPGRNPAQSSATVNGNATRRPSLPTIPLTASSTLSPRPALPVMPKNYENVSPTSGGVGGPQFRLPAPTSPRFGFSSTMQRSGPTSSPEFRSTSTGRTAPPPPPPASSKLNGTVPRPPAFAAAPPPAAPPMNRQPAAITHGMSSKTPVGLPSSRSAPAITSPPRASMKCPPVPPPTPPHSRQPRPPPLPGSSALPRLPTGPPPPLPPPRMTSKFR